MSQGLEKVKNKLRNNELVIGSHVGFGESCFSEMLGEVGYDYIWIDAEHSPLTLKDIQLHILAVKAAGRASFVRIPWNNHVLAKPVLDMGPDGIIFPMIRTKEEAEKAIASCLYPPEGIRGIGTRRANNYGLNDRQAYFKNYKEELFKIIQIEDINGFKNMEAILTVPHIDMIVVGPNDLAASLGKPNQTNDKEVIEILNKIAEKVKSANIPLAVSMGYDLKVIKEWMSRQIDCISVGFDFGFMAKAAKETYDDIYALTE